jgi:hypothetical protein
VASAVAASVSASRAASAAITVEGLCMSIQRFFQGETARIGLRFHDPEGAALPATGVAFVVRPPSGAAVAIDLGEIVEAGTGVAYIDLPLPTPGRWRIRGTCAGPTAAVVEVEFTVAASVVLV